MAIKIFIENINLPFYWDTAAFLMGAAENVAHTGDILNYAKDGSDYPHTFLLILVHAVLFKIGQPVLLSHIFSVFYSIFFLKIVHSLANKIIGKKYSLLVVILFLTNPLFISQTNLVYFEIIGAAFRLLSLNLLFENKINKSFLAALIAFLIRFENGFIILFCYIAYYFLKIKNVDKKQLIEFKINKHQYIANSISLFLIIIMWLLVHYLKADWWIYSPNRYFVENHLLTFVQSMDYLFLWQGRFSLTLLAVISIIFLIFKTFSKKIKFQLPTEIKILLLTSLAMIVIITKLGYFLPRYVFSILPVFYILCVYLLKKTLNNKHLIYILIIIVSLIQLSKKNQCFAQNFEDCLLSTEIIRAKQQSCKYIADQIEHEKLTADYMESYELKIYQNIDIEPMVLNTDTIKYIYITPTSSGELYQFATKNNYSISKTFYSKENNIKLYIYEKTE